MDELVLVSNSGDFPVDLKPTRLFHMPPGKFKLAHYVRCMMHATISLMPVHYCGQYQEVCGHAVILRYIAPK